MQLPKQMLIHTIKHLDMEIQDTPVITYTMLQDILLIQRTVILHLQLQSTAHHHVIQQHMDILLGILLQVQFPISQEE